MLLGVLVGLQSMQKDVVEAQNQNTKKVKSSNSWCLNVQIVLASATADVL